MPARASRLAVGIGVLGTASLALANSGTQLPLQGDYPQEIVVVMQGTIVICVVVAYELVRRYGLKRQQQKVGAELAAQAAAAANKEVAA